MNKKFLSVLLSLVLIITVVIQPTGATDSTNTDNEYNFELIQKDENIVKVKATRDNGDELYATMDKNTSEVTMEAVEKQQQNLFSILGVTESVNETTLYTVDIETLDGPIVDATLTNVDTGQAMKISENVDRVSAQLPLLVPVVQWGGSALLAWLASHALSITIAGITAYVITDLAADIKRNKQYNYWPAWIRKNDIYVGGEAFPNDRAAFNWINEKNSGEYNVFARTLSKADQAAKSVTGLSKYNSEHQGAEGHYPHYHPLEPDRVTQFKNHAWFMNGT
ncbi:hypothetical protein [Paenibacillus amylolyticus]|uniref:hypothetical protein n=1 Tax=Paenibacillus amylolyticus TaxID=1451 RepID=UPI003EC147CC